MLGHCKDTGSQDEEDAPEVEMAETKVPTKELLLWFREINVGVG